MIHETLGSSPVEWAGRTYREVRAVAGEDGSVVVVPIASLEQHGHHLPVSTDTLLVDAVATLGAERASDGGVPVLVTPVEWIGHSPHHMTFGGTITADFDHLLALVEDVVDAALDNGFDAALILNGHGGNASLVESATRTLGPRYHGEAEILAVTYFGLAGPFVDDVRESESGGMGHAGEFETALLCHLRPDLVGDDRAANYWDGDMFADPDTVASYSEIADHSDSGVMGDPGPATAEKGAELYDRLGDALADRLEEIHARNA